MSDWFGLAFLLVFFAGFIFVLKRLGKTRKRTAGDFDNRAASGTSLLSAGINSLNGILDPRQAKSKIIVTELKKGRFNKKEHEENSDRKKFETKRVKRKIK